MRISDWSSDVCSSDLDFLVIARCEALIAGLGEAEALARSAAYEAAGADMILIHSKQKTPDEVESYVRACTGKVPIVVVPTAYPERAEELRVGHDGVRTCRSVCSPCHQKKNTIG